jgi:hypothetical protein
MAIAPPDHALRFPARSVERQRGAVRPGWTCISSDMGGLLRV